MDCSKIDIDVSDGPKRTAVITVKILDLSAVADEDTEVAGKYVFPSTWFFRQGICGKSTHVSTNNILEYADMMLVHNFYEMLKKLSRVVGGGHEWFCVASNGQQLKEVERDERVSRHFMNCLNHFMTHLKRGDLKLQSVKSHCFFLSSSQMLDLIDDVSELAGHNGFDVYRGEVFQAHANWKSSFDQFDLLNPQLQEVGFNWRVRLNRSPRRDPLDRSTYMITGGNTAMGRYVETNRKNNMDGLQPASSTVASHSTQYSHSRTLYEGGSLQSLAKLIRNIRAHWVNTRNSPYDLRTTLCPITAKVNFDPGSRDAPEMHEEFFKYWTRRFPGLATVVYAIAVATLNKGLNGSLHHRDLNKMNTVFGNYTMDEDPDKPFNYEEVVEPTEPSISLADMPKL